MKKLLLLLLLLIPIIKAEAALDEIVCSNGWKIKIGDTLQIGKGSLPKGFYEHIWYTPYVKGQVPNTNIDGARMIVIRESLTPLKRSIRLTLIGDKGQHYKCNIEASLKSKEVIAPENFWNYRKYPLGAMLSYTGQISVGAGKDAAMQRLMSWFKGYYNDTLGRINKVNREKGSFSGVAGFKYISSYSLGNAEIKGNICYTLNATITDGSLKYEFTDFIHQPDTMAKGAFAFGFLLLVNKVPAYAIDREHGTLWSQKIWLDMKHQADSVMKIVLPQFKEAMSH